jgi:hypothetical protein
MFELTGDPKKMPRMNASSGGVFASLLTDYISVVKSSLNRANGMPKLELERTLNFLS